MDKNEQTENDAPGMSVLVVDDDEYFHKLLTRQLEAIGIGQVSVALSGAGALAHLGRAGHPDLIICDLRMPTMSGVEFLQHLNLEGFAGGVLLVSGEDERMLQSVSELVRAHRLTLLGALSKPVASGELESLLREWRERPVALRRRPDRRTVAPGEEQLRQALKDGEIEVHLQPIVDLHGGRVVGVEALARWFDEQGDEIPAASFTALAERCGLAGALTLNVLRAAMRDLASWPDWSLAVNVFNEDLSSSALPEHIRQIAERTGFAMGRLVLDVAHNPFADDAAQVLDVSNRLSLQGVQLAIDGTGVGYAELESLLRIPFGEFKIDGRFLRGAHERDRAETILSAHVKLARELGLTVVAEGVAEQADWDLALRCGCDRAQGHFVAPAMPLPALKLWAEWYAARS